MDLQELYNKKYKAEANRVESQFDSRPNPLIKFICGGLMSIEGITVFSLLLPNGIVAALVGAALPISFLLGIAYLYAEFFELPPAYQQLVDEYTAILAKDTELDD
jgi:hypothetical protein